jgi:phosphoglycerate-specific signal transduction histidine kinase
MEQKRAAHLASLERDAEILVALQLDLVAQVECQLRAVRRTMRQIEQLRSAERRVGRELSNGEKATTLHHLTDELTAIDQELNTQHESCREMQSTVDKMLGTLRGMKQASAAESSSGEPESPHQPPA